MFTKMKSGHARSPHRCFLTAIFFQYQALFKSSHLTRLSPCLHALIFRCAAKCFDLWWWYVEAPPSAPRGSSSTSHSSYHLIRLSSPASSLHQERSPRLPVFNISSTFAAPSCCVPPPSPPYFWPRLIPSFEFHICELPFLTLTTVRSLSCLHHPDTASKSPLCCADSTIYHLFHL